MLEFRFGKTVIEFRFLFLAVLTLCFLIDETGIAVLGLLAGVMHECGHLIMVILTGFAPKRVAFEMTGIRMEQPTECMSDKKEVAVLLAGSLVNGIFAVVSFLVGWEAFGSVHLVLGVLNLLPMKGLDGGKLLILFFSRFTDLYRAEKVVLYIQIVFNIILTTICIMLFMNQHCNLTLFIFCIYLWASIWQ